jgi:hypothetical protein
VVSRPSCVVRSWQKTIRNAVGHGQWGWCACVPRHTSRSRKATDRGTGVLCPSVTSPALRFNRFTCLQGNLFLCSTTSRVRAFARLELHGGFVRFGFRKQHNICVYLYTLESGSVATVSAAHGHSARPRPAIRNQRREKKPENPPPPRVCVNRTLTLLRAS